MRSFALHEAVSLIDAVNIVESVVFRASGVRHLHQNIPTALPYVSLSGRQVRHQKAFGASRGYPLLIFADILRIRHLTQYRPAQHFAAIPHRYTRRGHIYHLNRRRPCCFDNPFFQCRDPFAYFGQQGRNGPEKAIERRKIYFDRRDNRVEGQG